MIETPQARIIDNWRHCLEEIGEAAVASGRHPANVRVIGVTKYVDAETSRMLVEAGCSDLGESRPQQLVDKAITLAGMSPLQWHLIGSLQRNKVRRTLEHAHAIHSIDSIKLLRFVDSIAGELQLATQVLIEVNISGDASKHGFTAETLFADSAALCEVAHVHIAGLMAMAGLESSLDEAQREFAMVRQLRDRLAIQTGLPLAELSMGMSGDYRQAISEGATMVRIGTRLFEGLKPS
jgi:pyridoxal phosphate enzyme (YggS family)